MSDRLRAGLKILVSVKRVIDYAVKIRISKDGQWVETENVKHSMNPFDEIAVEAALRIREGDKKGTKSEKVSSICVASFGCAKSIDTIKTALAMGADKGIHVDTTTLDNISPENGPYTLNTLNNLLHFAKEHCSRWQYPDC